MAEVYGVDDSRNLASPITKYEFEFTIDDQTDIEEGRYRAVRTFTVEELEKVKDLDCKVVFEETISGNTGSGNGYYLVEFKGITKTYLHLSDSDMKLIEYKFDAYVQHISVHGSTPSGNLELQTFVISPGASNDFWFWIDILGGLPYQPSLKVKFVFEGYPN